MITLPGDIPGLLRRCSPLPDGDVVFAVDTKDGTALCGEVAQTDAGPLQGWVNLSDIDLDLTNATGRLHFRMWLAAHIIGDKGGEYLDDLESSWLYGYLFDPEEAATIVGAVAMDSNRAICCWAIQTPAGHAWSWTTTDERTDPIEDPERHHETPLAALNDLDPNDSRTLPDGSLWVLAEAMRRIGLHVAGRT